VIPRTHLMCRNVRPGPLFPNAFESIHGIVKEFLIDVPLKAGEAIIFNHSLLHASPPNLSEENRVALSVGFTHNDSPLIHHYLNSSPQLGESAIVEVMEINDLFFETYIRGQKPCSTRTIFFEEQFFMKVDKLTFFYKMGIARVLYNRLSNARPFPCRKSS